MDLTARECWLLLHLGVSVVYLHAFSTGLAEVRLGVQRNRLLAGTAIMALVAWLTVISGTWFVYPWYRAEPPSESAQLQDYPQYYLEEHHNLAYWHEFGKIGRASCREVVILYEKRLTGQMTARR